MCRKCKYKTYTFRVVLPKSNNNKLITQVAFPLKKDMATTKIYEIIQHGFD